MPAGVDIAHHLRSHAYVCVCILHDINRFAKSNISCRIRQISECNVGPDTPRNVTYVWHRRSGLVISRKQGLHCEDGFAVPVLMSACGMDKGALRVAVLVVLHSESLKKTDRTSRPQTQAGIGHSAIGAWHRQGRQKHNKDKRKSYDQPLGGGRGGCWVEGCG